MVLEEDKEVFQNFLHARIPDICDRTSYDGLAFSEKKIEGVIGRNELVSFKFPEKIYASFLVFRFTSIDAFKKQKNCMKVIQHKIYYNKNGAVLDEDKPNAIVKFE
ncbi:hypothetical protein SNEBB_004004, partial [Seison nebaliae]